MINAIDERAHCHPEMFDLITFLDIFDIFSLDMT